jgi:hypothetical protein
MAPLQTNAVLTAVRGADVSGDDWDDVDQVGTAVWSGGAYVYLTETEDRVRTQTTQDVLIRRTLLVDPQDPPVDWQQGYTVTLTRRDGTTFTGVVQGVARSVAPPGYEIVATKQLILRPA